MSTEDELMTTNKTAAKPARTARIANFTATALTKDCTNKSSHLTCPECGGINGVERLNQPCDFCGLTLKTRLFPDHERYIRGLDVTASGRDTYDIGDLTADTLRGMDEDDVVRTTAKALAGETIEIALSVKIGRQFKKAGYSWSTNGIKAWLSARYEGRNPGMVRMNCGNLLRGAVKRHDAIDGEA